MKKVRARPKEGIIEKLSFLTKNARKTNFKNWRGKMGKK